MNLSRGGLLLGGRWALDGAHSLADAAARLRELADTLDRMDDEVKFPSPTTAPVKTFDQPPPSPSPRRRGRGEDLSNIYFRTEEQERIRDKEMRGVLGTGPRRSTNSVQRVKTQRFNPMDKDRVDSMDELMVVREEKELKATLTSTFGNGSLEDRESRLEEVHERNQAKTISGMSVRVPPASVKEHPQTGALTHTPHQTFVER